MLVMGSKTTPVKYGALASHLAHPWTTSGDFRGGKLQYRRRKRSFEITPGPRNGTGCVVCVVVDAGDEVVDEFVFSEDEIGTVFLAVFGLGVCFRFVTSLCQLSTNVRSNVFLFKTLLSSLINTVRITDVHERGSATS